MPISIKMKSCTPRQLQTRIKPNYVPLSRLSMDLKVMPRSHKDHRYILCVINEVTIYLMTVPICQARLEEIGEALIENVITKYCIPEYIIMDQDSAFMSSLMTYQLNKFGIKRQFHPTTTNPFRLKHRIKSLSLHFDKSSNKLGQM